MAAPMEPSSPGGKSDILDNIWMIRPCFQYVEEYNECRDGGARRYQRFVYGQKLDCSRWQRMLTLCQKYERARSPEAAAELIALEEQRRAGRLKLSARNDVWEYRDAPPTDWLAPLPEHMLTLPDTPLYDDDVRTPEPSETGNGPAGTGSASPGTGSAPLGTGSASPGTGSASLGTGSASPGTGSASPGTGSEDTDVPPDRKSVV